MNYAWIWICTFIAAILILTILLISTYKRCWNTLIIWWKRKLVGKFISTVILPMLIPFFVSIVVKLDERFSWWERSDRIIIIVLAISCIIMLINSVIQFFYWRKEQTEAYLRWENRASSYAYNGLYKIHKDKNMQFRMYSHKCPFNGSVDANQIPYDIFSQIQNICTELANTISLITMIPTVRLSVSFIYHYTYENANDFDRQWRWIIGRNSKFKTNLQQFVATKGSIYYHMVHEKVPFVFYNDKMEARNRGHYYYSSKDRLHSEAGSLFASKFAFNNNNQNCCEAIIMITSYGEKFVKGNMEYTENEYRQLLLDKILPCYKNLLQSELGMLYFRHKTEK